MTAILARSKSWQGGGVTYTRHGVAQANEGELLKASVVVFCHGWEMDISRSYQCQRVILFPFRNELLH